MGCCCEVESSFAGFNLMRSWFYYLVILICVQWLLIVGQRLLLDLVLRNSASAPQPSKTYPLSLMYSPTESFALNIWNT